MALTDGDDRHLDGREPDGKCSGVMLDQHAEKTLHGTIKRAMDHDRLFARAIFRHVFQLESVGQVEVELHGGKLPGAADGVHQFDVNLGAVKRGFAHNRLVGNIHLLQDLLQRVDSAVPVLLAADKTLFVVGVPYAQLDLVFSEAKSLEHGHGEFHAAHHFALNLLRRAEDVGVILGKAAHAQQAVHHAGTLVTVYRAQLAVTLRQVAIGAHGIGIDEDM